MSVYQIGETPTPSAELVEKVVWLMKHPALKNVGVKELFPDHPHLSADVKSEYSKKAIEAQISHIAQRPRRFRKQI